MSSHTSSHHNHWRVGARVRHAHNGSTGEVRRVFERRGRDDAQGFVVRWDDDPGHDYIYYSVSNMVVPEKR
jgi:hypothetical protein